MAGESHSNSPLETLSYKDFLVLIFKVTQNVTQLVRKSPLIGVTVRRYGMALRQTL